MEENPDEVPLKSEEDSESNYSIQESAVSNDFDQSGSSIQGSEGVKDNQSDSSAQGSEKVGVYLDQSGKYDKIKDENANIKTLLGKRPAGFPELPARFRDIDKGGVKKYCDNSDKNKNPGLPIISDVWSERNPTELSGLFGSGSPKKNKVEEEWKQTFKISNELPDPAVLFGNVGKNSKFDDSLFKKPTKPAPIPLAKVSWKPPVLTGENSLDEKLLSGPGNMAQSIPSELMLAKCSFLEADSFNTCGGSMICMNQTGKPDNIPVITHPQPSKCARTAPQKTDHKVPVGSTSPNTIQEVKKKVQRKLDKPEKSHINRAIKTAQPRNPVAYQRKTNSQPRMTTPKPARNIGAQPRNPPAQPRPVGIQHNPRLPNPELQAPPSFLQKNVSNCGMVPPQQFEFTLGSHYTGGNMFCARQVEAPTNQMVVPTDFVKGLMKTRSSTHVDPAVDIVTRSDMKRFLKVPEKGFYPGSPYSDPNIMPQTPMNSTHSAIKALLSNRSRFGEGVKSSSEVRMPWTSVPPTQSFSAPASPADKKCETKSVPSSPKDIKNTSSKPSSPSFAEKIAKFKAEIPSKTPKDKDVELVEKHHDFPKTAEGFPQRRNTIGSDVRISAGLDARRKSWLNSDSLLPPNMPLTLNISEKKDVSNQSSDHVQYSPRASSTTSYASCVSCAPSPIESGSLLPPNFPLSLESPGQQSLTSTQSSPSPRKPVDQAVTSADKWRQLPTNLNYLLPPGVPLLLDGQEKRPIVPLPQMLQTNMSPQLSANAPWTFGSYETSRNLQYSIQIADAMKKSSYLASPSFPKPFINTSMGGVVSVVPETQRVRQLPTAPGTGKGDKSQPNEISPSRSKDDGYSTSSSLQGSPNQQNRKIPVPDMNTQISPSLTQSGIPIPQSSNTSGTQHICNSPKKRRFIPPPEAPVQSEAAMRSFYTMPQSARPMFVPLGHEAQPSPHGSPLRRNIEQTSPVHHYEPLPPSMSSPYRRNYEPAEQAFKVQLLGISSLPQSIQEHVGQEGGFHTGFVGPKFTSNIGTEHLPVGSVVCPADSTEEKNNEPLNLVVTKPRAKTALTELTAASGPRELAMDLRVASHESAMDLRTNKHEVTDPEGFQSYYQHGPGKFSDTNQDTSYSHSSDPTNPDAKSSQPEVSRNDLYVAKDSGVDIVNQFLQSMHSIRYKDSKGETTEQNSENVEIDNVGEMEPTNAVVINQSDSQDLMQGGQVDTVMVCQLNTEGASLSQNEQILNGQVSRDNGTSSVCKQSETSNGLPTKVESSMLTEINLTHSFSSNQGQSASSVASDCYFCGEPGQVKAEDGSCSVGLAPTAGTPKVNPTQDASLSVEQIKTCNGSPDGRSSDISDKFKSNRNSCTCSSTGCTCSHLSCLNGATSGSTERASGQKTIEDSSVNNTPTPTLKQVVSSEPNGCHSTNSQIVIEDISVKPTCSSGLYKNSFNDVKVPIDNACSEIDSGHNNIKFDVKVLAAFPLDSSEPSGNYFQEFVPKPKESNVELELETDDQGTNSDKLDLNSSSDSGDLKYSIDADMEVVPLTKWFISQNNESPESSPEKGSSSPCVPKIKLIHAVQKARLMNSQGFEGKMSVFDDGMRSGAGKNDTRSPTENLGSEGSNGPCTYNVPSGNVSIDAKTTFLNSQGLKRKRLSSFDGAFRSDTDELSYHSDSLDYAKTVAPNLEVSTIVSDGGNGGCSQTVKRLKRCHSWEKVELERDVKSVLGRKYASGSAGLGLHMRLPTAMGEKVPRNRKVSYKEDGTGLLIRILPNPLKKNEDFDQSLKMDTLNGAFQMEDSTLSSDSSNLVIDETALPSSDESRHSDMAADSISDNLHLLASVSTEYRYAKTQKLPLLTAISEKLPEFRKDSNKFSVSLLQHDFLSEKQTNERPKGRKGANDSEKRPVVIKGAKKYSISLLKQEIPTEMHMNVSSKGLKAASFLKNKPEVKKEKLSPPRNSASKQNSPTVKQKTYTITEKIMGVNITRQVTAKDMAQEYTRPFGIKKYQMSWHGGRKLLPEWIEDQVEQGDIPGLMWMNGADKVIRIPWRHSRSTSWVEEDCLLFQRWAIHTGKYIPGDQPNPKRWKTNFRCALNLYAVRLDHGKDYCCYKIFDSAITGPNAMESKKVKKQRELTPQFVNKSGLDEILDGMSTASQIPTVIFDLEKEEEKMIHSSRSPSNSRGKKTTESRPKRYIESGACSVKVESDPNDCDVVTGMYNSSSVPLNLSFK